MLILRIFQLDHVLSTALLPTLVEGEGVVRRESASFLCVTALPSTLSLLQQSGLWSVPAYGYKLSYLQTLQAASRLHAAFYNLVSVRTTEQRRTRSP